MHDTPPQRVLNRAPLPDAASGFMAALIRAAGELGAKLELAALKRTAALQPPHKYVPWIVVNDVPLRRDYTSLGSYICEALSDPKCAP